MANGKCRAHGGATPSGIACVNTRHGRYSKSLPVRLQARFEEAATDPDLLNMREDIALLDARLSDVLEQASNQESGELWQGLKDALRTYDKATGRDAETTRADAFASIRFLINEGYNERQSWQEIRSILQERKALVESERKRLIDMQQMITATQANLLLGAVAHIIKSNVTDRDALQRISAELGQLVNRGG